MNHKETTLREKADEFLIYKRGIGYIYDTQAHYLMKYITYAEMLSADIRMPDKNSVMSFLDDYSDAPGALYGATAVLREFGRHLHSIGINEAYIVPAKRMPKLTPEPPYFFREIEIEAFFEVCDQIQPHKSLPGRELVVPVLFRLLYCCGMRCKEVRTLAYSDVHLEQCFIDVIQSKGPKSRRIYINKELAGYLNTYDISVKAIFSDRTHFFPHTANGFYTSGMVSKNFQRYWRKAFPDFPVGTRTRAYDFRHHFAWTNLNRWAKEGLDVNIMLPYLMRYMGHQTVESTLYYFRFVPDFYPTYQELSVSAEDILPEVPDEE